MKNQNNNHSNNHTSRQPLPSLDGRGRGWVFSPPFTGGGGGGSVAILAALAAGRDIMAIYDAPDADFGIERKADNSPLTRADKAAHARIMSFLEPTGIPVLSEEGAHLPYSIRHTWKRLWIVDPLDGTKEFIKRNGEFTVNIALVEDGVPVMGVIYRPRPTPDPSREGRGEAGALYFASKEMGAWRADIYDDEDIEHIIHTAKPLPCYSRRPPLPDGWQQRERLNIVSEVDFPVLDECKTGLSLSKQSSEKHVSLGLGVGLSEVGLPPSLTGRGRGWVCVASRSHLSPETAAFIEELRKEHPDLELISSGSSLKICLVAEGKADIYPRHAPTMEWDTAAGDAIARAAGCQVVNAQTGQPLIYNKEDLHNPWFIVRR